jgi:hypothetical protein
MPDVQQLLNDASAKLRHEADAIRATIAEKEASFRREVDPLRTTLGELDAAIARIEGKPTSSSDTGTAKGQRAPRGQNKQRIHDALAAGVALSPVQIAERTGIAKPTIYATLAKLASDGEIRKESTADGVRYQASTGSPVGTSPGRSSRRSARGTARASTTDRRS